MRRKDKPIKIGVLGVGASLHHSARGYLLGSKLEGSAGFRLVAFCDSDTDKLQQVAARTSATTYTDYDRFLEHDLDAVILANFFHQHASFAIRALESGKHVLSETTACFTPAEGVALVEAVEKSGKVYMLAENYAYFGYNQEMRRLYRSGSMGEFRYGEGEYVHPMSAEFHNCIAPGIDHWRNWMPITFYCTHSLAPLMFITGENPVQVNCLVIPRDPNDQEHFGLTAKRNDLASVFLLRMGNGAVVKLLWGQLRGLGAWVSVRCTRGMMENLRFGDTKMLRIRREPFDRKQNEPIEQVYLPEFPKPFDKSGLDGHSGADMCMYYAFARAVRGDQEPDFDVYRSVALSLVGIQGYRSALASGTPMEIPDFRSKTIRNCYRKDHWSSDPSRKAPGQPYPSVLGDVQIPDSALRRARKDWKKIGYTGD